MTQVDVSPFKKYVLALGPGRDVPPGQSVNDRYWVLSPGVWHDTQAPDPPEHPDTVSAAAKPYLQAYPHQLHIPTVYGECPLDSGSVLLLDNVPIDRHGRLMPTLGTAWASATPFRQAYWCWQLFSLWPHLFGLNMAASLSAPEVIHVDGWRIRLSNLIPGRPPLKALAQLIATLLPKSTPTLASNLKSVLDQCETSEPETQPNFDQILEHLNRVLLTQAMEISLATEVAGSTNSGQQPHNEDACYPSQVELERASTADLSSLPRMAIVCDGVGGHAGGEVASQTVVRSLQLQLRSLLAEIAEQDTPLPPYIVMGQIEAAIRVANNLVASQNDQQGRTERQRMGTTLVAAVMIPQRLPTTDGHEDVNELYIAHVGDSRAYWITPEACHLLTVDDDVAGREITAGHSYPTVAQARDDAGALTQALGTREADSLTPHVQRFLLDETGVLLLCSDGLSDHQRVETSWANYIGLIVKNIVPLPTAVESWVELANQKNGHDNIAVVLMHCTISGDTVVVEDSIPNLTPQEGLYPTELTAASKALLYGESEEPAEDPDPVTSTEAPPRRSLQAMVLGILLLIAFSVAGVAGVFLWQNFGPSAPPTETDPLPNTSTTDPDF
ncbi:protein phosphatase 2C domain-containing protein [Leptolyngbya cf. ectocarpi LEGE 11479]|uniref:Protein phosphatase 2C domain-containing protein n=1 Tax=Leptolyngbya cf. ectocarpi LEGE 11479 TaxID=1828722 RepID=A0A928X3Y1_LEPEC|nr:protein phosphatase 2C domain-containing protein [Leptolyngbya ectocarpi]MBE9067296.1 protein phosphatase 2C domain-containing protein [Leptolyngbya cf. ectocarpi LEGE 11479]